MRISTKTSLLRIDGGVLAFFVLLVAIDHNLAHAKTVKPERFVEEFNWPPFTPDHEGMTKEGLSYDLIFAVFVPITLARFLCCGNGYPKRYFYVSFKALILGTLIFSNSFKECGVLVTYMYFDG